MDDDQLDDFLHARALRLFGLNASDTIAWGADRRGSTVARRFFGPEANARAAHDLARGEGHRCSSCNRLGTEQRTLIEGPDPYQSEINDDDSVVLLCEGCHRESCDDI
jgi:hypothetical protein